MNRTRQFVRGLFASYFQLALTAVCGLWLTKYLLANVGEKLYGNWLVLIQLLAYLELADLGVLSVLPREVAYATGKASAGQRLNAARLVTRTAWKVVWIQMPLAIAASLCFWWLASKVDPTFFLPAGIVALAYVCLFPFRIYSATLLGLQDLAYIGWLNSTTWLLQFGITACLVLFGIGVWALTIAWVAQRVVYSTCSLARYYWQIPRGGITDSTSPSVSALLASGLWVSISRISQWLQNGTELIIIAKLLGPEMVVSYVCTGKLIGMFSPHIYGIMTTAETGLSELRQQCTNERVIDISRILGLLMLLGSGLLAVIVLSTNKGFVDWWVGADHYAGIGITWLFIGAMLLWNITFALSHLLYCFGCEKQLAIITIIDGLLCVAFTWGCVSLLDNNGVALGALIGVLFFSFPVRLWMLSSLLNISPLSLLYPYYSWAWRFLLLSLLITVLVLYKSPKGLFELFIATIVSACIYFILQWPVIRRSSLWPKLQNAWSLWVN